MDLPNNICLLCGKDDESPKKCCWIQRLEMYEEGVYAKRKNRFAPEIGRTCLIGKKIAFCVKRVVTNGVESLEQ